MTARVVLAPVFLLDVKGLYRINPWLIIEAGPSRFFYILIYVPAGAPNQLFVLRQSDVNLLVQAELKRLARPAD